MTYCAVNVLDIRNGNHVIHVIHKHKKKLYVKTMIHSNRTLVLQSRRITTSGVVHTLKKNPKQDNPMTWSHKF